MSRVLKEVDFDRKFEQLPKFNPDAAPIADSCTPLPKSPRDIVNSYRKKRKPSIG
jgi:capicua transcriptional repressor